MLIGQTVINKAIGQPGYTLGHIELSFSAITTRHCCGYETSSVRSGPDRTMRSRFFERWNMDMDCPASLFKQMFDSWGDIPMEQQTLHFIDQLEIPADEAGSEQGCRRPSVAASCGPD